MHADLLLLALAHACTRALSGRRTRLASACCWLLAQKHLLPACACRDPSWQIRCRACSPPRAGRESHRSGAAGGLSRDRRSGQVSGGRVVLVLGDTCGTKQIRGRHLGECLAACPPAGRLQLRHHACVSVCLLTVISLLISCTRRRGGACDGLALARLMTRFVSLVCELISWRYGLRCVRNRERDVVGGACALGRLLQLGSVSFHSSRRHALICQLPFRHERRCKRPTSSSGIKAPSLVVHCWLVSVATLNWVRI